MTQRHTGDLGRRTLAGRAVAIMWMIGSIIAIAMFTGEHHLGVDDKASPGPGARSG